MHRFVVVFLLCGACSDYSFTEKGPPESGASPETAPDIRVDPGDISLGGICGVSDEVVIVANVGDADLRVEDATVDGEGWTVDTSGLPSTLPPGSSLELPVAGSAGEARLVVQSNDPDQPAVEVALSAQADAAPLVRITSPTEGDVIGSAGTTFRATVSDAEDGPEPVSLSWFSNVDGVFGTASAGADGIATARWSGHTPGAHMVTLTATDSCGNTATSLVGVCQDAGYTSDELDIAAWHFEGVARWDTTNDWLELTPVAGNVVGTAFATDTLVSGGNVQIRFLFYIGDGTGADGISLTTLDADRMSTFLGGTGCGIGYGGDAPCTSGPALPGWSIEVDTYYNADADPTEADHLAFTFDGDVDNPAAWAELPEMEDTGWHEMVVEVVAPHVTVSVDGVVYIDQDLSGWFGFPGYVGFTAGTGGQTNQHLIDALEVTESVCGG